MMKNIPSLDIVTFLDQLVVILKQTVIAAQTLVALIE